MKKAILGASTQYSLKVQQVYLLLPSKGDAIADLIEDLATEQKAHATYENLISLSDDPEVIDPLRFLREREVVHFQRFGEALRIVQNRLAQRMYFLSKPEVWKKIWRSNFSVYKEL